MLAFLSRFIDEADECELLQIVADLPAVAPGGPWIAGGAIRRTLLQDKLESDFDFFFRSPEQKAEFVETLTEDHGAWLISEREHAATYGVKFDQRTLIVQAITMAYYESPEAVIDSFDFTITQFAYDGTDLICGEFSLWDLSRKRLALHKLTYGVSTVRRLIKYTKQGFTACSGVLAAILGEVVDHPEVIHREVQYVD